MEELIKALLIFKKYGNPLHPTNCTHDELFVDIDPELVSQEDREALSKLSFETHEDEGFSSYRFGSC